MKAVVLSSSLLTERMILHSSFLDALHGKAEIRYWTTSDRNLILAADVERPEFRIKKFPEVMPFKELPYNYLRRLNEYVLDYKLRPPGRLSMDRLIKKDSVRARVRSLKFPARIISLLDQHQR